MDLPVLLRQALSGDKRVSFYAAVLAAATTRRPGAGRWTELTVYRLPRVWGEDPARGGYAVSKVGRSVVIHRPTCSRVRPRQMRGVRPMRSVEGWVPCLECLPHEDPQEDQTGMLEADRYTLLQARTPADLARVLLQGRPGEAPARVLTGIVAETVRQVRRADPDFDQWWPDHLYPEGDSR